MIFENMDRIVFAGDSITDMGSDTPVGEGLFESLGRGYVRIIENMLATWYPEKMIRVTNSGISGNTSRDLLKRYQKDVIDLEPDWVSICIGINDVSRQFDCPAMPDIHVLPDEYESNLKTMILDSRKRVKGIFIISPFCMEPYINDPLRKKTDEYREICKKLAEKHRCIFIDVQNAFDRYFAYRHPSYIALDRVHPNLIGATIIAREFLERCDFSYDHIPA